MENQEIWKPVVGYEGIYEVSDLGRVRRVKAAQGTLAGKVLTPIKGRFGYFSVHLHADRKRKLVRIHRLVADAFHGTSELPLVRHLDGNPQNNIPSNLAHGTAQDNANDRVAHGNQFRGNQNSGKTHCKNGHEFSIENTRLVLQSNGRPTRICQECSRDKARAWEARRPKRIRNRH